MILVSHPSWASNEEASKNVPRLADPDVLHERIDGVLLVVWAVALSQNLDWHSPLERSAHHPSKGPELLRVRRVVKLRGVEHQRPFRVRVEHRLSEVRVKRSGVGLLNL